MLATHGVSALWGKHWAAAELGACDRLSEPLSPPWLECRTATLWRVWRWRPLLAYQGTLWRCDSPNSQLRLSTHHSNTCNHRYSREIHCIYDVTQGREHMDHNTLLIGSLHFINQCVNSSVISNIISLSNHVAHVLSHPVPSFSILYHMHETVHRLCRFMHICITLLHSFYDHSSGRHLIHM